MQEDCPIVLARYEEVFDELEIVLFYLSKAMDFHEHAKSCPLHDLITRSQAIKLWLPRAEKWLIHSVQL